MSDSVNVQLIRLEKLKPFKNYPFTVRDNEQLRCIADSVRSVGILTPAIVRPLENGYYEIISGHRRKRACELAGIPVLPVIVKRISYDEATILMVDSNLQRDVILPSERAKAYKMKLDALKRQGTRNDLTSDQVGQKLSRKTTREQIASESPDSSTQIHRYLRLNALIPELLQLVDLSRIALTPAVELSFLTPAEQKQLFITIESEDATPSLSQSQRMKRLSQQGKLSEDMILQIMLESKKPESWNLSLPIQKISPFFPSYYTPQHMEKTIFKLLDAWKRSREKE